MSPSISTSANRLLRRALVASTSATLLLAAAAPAWARPAADIDVDWECTSVHVSADKDLSNVVLGFEDGDEVKFDGLDQGSQGTFSGIGDDADAVIATVWVKAGNNHSGDGSGYGKRFDNPLDCGSEQAALQDEDTIERDETEQDESTPDDDTAEPGDDGDDADDDADDTTDEGDDETDEGDDEGDDQGDDAPTPAAPEVPTDTPTPAATDVDASTEAAAEQPSPSPAADDTDVLGIALDRPAPRVVAAASDVRPAPATALPRTGLPLAVLALGGLSSLLVGAATLRHGRRRDPDTTDVPGIEGGMQGPATPASNLFPVSQSVAERDGDVSDADVRPRTGVPSILIAVTAAAALVAGAHAVRHRR